MKTKVQKALRFLSTDVWRIRLRDLPPRKFFLIKHLRIILLAARGFHADRCVLRASALTFYCILSLVPVAAMAFGIAKGFGLEKMLESHLRKYLEGQEMIADQVITFAHNLLQNVKGGLMAGIGVVILLWTVIKVLGNIEKSFNDIWGVKKNRSLPRKFSDYLSVVFIAPILLVLSTSATVAITTQLSARIVEVPVLSIVAPLIILLLGLVPYFIGWALFAFVYLFLPNTKVNLRSAIIAGILAGTIFQLVQWAYIAFQVGVTRYSAVYGSFAALPLFLVWLQVSWLVVLFGAELSFAHQNVDTYEFEPDCLGVSRSFKNLVALRATQLLVDNFRQGKGPLTAQQISHELEVPIRLVNDIVFELVRANVLTETKAPDDDRQTGYQPARDTDALTTSYVISALEKSGADSIPVAETQDWKKLKACLDELDKARDKSAGNVPLREIHRD